MSVFGTEPHNNPDIAASLGSPYSRPHDDSSISQLTRLPMRQQFIDVATARQTSPPHRDTSCALMMFDIDKLIYYNDHFGHIMGDYLIVRIAGTIQSTLPVPLFQIGGDEFACIVESLDQSIHLADHICRSVRTIPSIPYPVAYHPTSVYRADYTVSIGIAPWCPTRESLTVAWDHMSNAVRATKQHGGNGWSVSQTHPSS